jgi:hypothetical protein
VSSDKIQEKIINIMRNFQVELEDVFTDTMEREKKEMIGIGIQEAQFLMAFSLASGKVIRELAENMGNRINLIPRFQKTLIKDVKRSLLLAYGKVDS